MDKTKIFKPLTFGTSGLRGKTEAMTDLECYINIKGFIKFLKERGELDHVHKDLALGGDLRSSTPRIMSALTQAIEDSQCKVLFCGNVPTPALAYYAMCHDLPSIMVTGSHIPDDRNGIKFTKKTGEILKSDENDILRNVALAREEEYARPQHESLFNDKGMFKENHLLPDTGVETEVRNLYIHRYLDIFKDKPLLGKKIVLYQHSAVGRDLIQVILEGLGANVIPLGRSSTFIAVDTEKITNDTILFLENTARRHEPFAIVSTDGDSDRPLLADENGQFVPGDKLGALVSLFLSPDFVAIPISANDAVVSSLEQKGIEVKQTRIGSPYVIEAMYNKLKDCPDSKVVGWESNGGFLLGSNWTIYDNFLRALPTRDAVLPIISLLLLAVKENEAISNLVTIKLPKRHTLADVIDNKTPGCETYTEEIGKTIIKMLSPENIHIHQVNFTEDGLRIEEGESDPETVNNLTGIRKKLQRCFTKERGFPEIVSINFLDGIRIVFSNNDVVHLRPSGNAPEFRLYATAVTMEKAQEIVQKRAEIISCIIRKITQ